MDTTNRSWLQASEEALRKNVPPLAASAAWIAHRLSALLIARLPEHWSRQLLDHLGEVDGRRTHILRGCLEPGGDPSIGYPDFVERAYEGLAFASPRDLPDAETAHALAHRAADVFLASVGGSIPANLSTDISRILPAELAVRFNPRPAGTGGYLPAA